jgi:hypothetical protein
MEDRETPRIHKYGETKTTRIMMATVRHVTAWAGRTKYQAAWFLLNRVYNNRMTVVRKYLLAFRFDDNELSEGRIQKLVRRQVPYKHG